MYNQKILIDKKNNSVFDITKYFLSIMVVAIHCNLSPEILYPWLRLAVPLFFLISSFFLFKKIGKATSEEKNSIVWNYIKRNAILYLFWFVVLLPLAIHQQHDIWIDEHNIFCILRFIRSLLFSSTFPASWYISSTITATVVVFYLSKKLNNAILLIISGACYFLACVSSSYPFVVELVPVLKNILSVVGVFIPVPYNSFLVGIFWITCGKCIAESKHQIRTNKLIIMIIISAILLEIEYLFHVKLTNTINSDLYFMLIPMSTSIFILLCRIPAWENKYGVTLRKISTLYYVMHLSVLYVIRALLDRIYHIKIDTGLQFVATLLIVTVLSIIILILEKNKKFSLLKYSH